MTNHPREFLPALTPTTTDRIEELFAILNATIDASG